MVDPGTMCKQHLLGEHSELHMLATALKRGTSIQGHLDNKHLEPQDLEERHQALVGEFARRGMAHESPLPDDLPASRPHGTVNPQHSLDVLWARCPACRVQRGKRLAQRIDAAWYNHKPQADSTYGSRRWLAGLVRITPQTLDKYLRGVHPPDRAEAYLDLLEQQQQPAHSAQ